MSYLLFVDESGYDFREAPYGVLAGVCVEDRSLWAVVNAVQDAELRFFGRRISEGLLELKAKKLLKAKTFRLAAQLPPMPVESCRDLARSCLEKSSDQVTRAELTALAQAKIAFVRRLLEIAAEYRMKAVASVVDARTPMPAKEYLRKDYAYLFERYYYLLEDLSPNDMGLVVFNELEHSQCHLLLGQMGSYFRDTATGRMRSGRVVPEPFFVHSHLTTLVQIADIVAYVISWGVRVGGMDQPARPELAELALQVQELRHCSHRPPVGQRPEHIWSFAVIQDLRSRSERGGLDDPA